MSPDEYKRILAKYLPAEAVEPIYAFFDQHGIFLHITRERQSKLGDYRWPQNGRNYHAISVNGNLNPYHFLLVLLHEMAHYNTYVRYGKAVKPHGHEWQEEYRQLIMQYLGQFPAEVVPLLRKYCSSIPLSRALEKEVESQLHRYDPDYNPQNDLTLDQLAPGTEFFVVKKPYIPFRALEKRRTRWICKNLNDGKLYLVSGQAQVKVQKEP